jgi:hypothetical protein
MLTDTPQMVPKIGLDNSRIWYRPGGQLAPEWVVGPFLANGELVEVLPMHPPVPDRTPLCAVHPYQRFVPPKVKTFVDFLVNRYGKGYDWARYKSNQGSGGTTLTTRASRVAAVAHHPRIGRPFR